MGSVELAGKRSFTSDEAFAIAIELGIDFGVLRCDLEQLRMGLGVELEHGYYTRVAVLEREAADRKRSQG